MNIRKIIGGFGIHVGGTLLVLLTSIVMARVAGEKTFGTYTIVFTWVNLLFIPALWGMDDLTVKVVGSMTGSSEEYKSRSFVRWALKNSMIAAISLISLFLLIVNLFPENGLSLYNKYFLTAFPVIFFMIGAMIWQCALRGKQLVNEGQLAERIIKPLLLVIGLLLFWVIQKPLTNEVLIFLNVFAFGGSMLFVFAQYQKHFKNDGIRYSFSSVEKRSWYKTGFNFMLISGLYLLATRLDMTVLSAYFADAPEQVAHYNIGLKVSEILMIPQVVMNNMTAPIFAKLNAEGEKSEIQKIYTNAVRWQFLTTLIGYFCFIFLGEWAIGYLYGDAYLAGFPVLKILCLGHLICSFFGPMGYLLMMVGHERLSLFSLVINLIIGLILLYVLIPLWGLEGAAWATVGGYVAYKSSLAVLAYRYAGMRVSIFG